MDIPSDVRCAPAVCEPEPAAVDSQRLVDVERAHIVRVLRKVSGHRARAARTLGISLRSLYRKLREYRLDEDDPSTGGLSDDSDPA